MPKELTVLKAAIRPETGKGPARRMRGAGRVPAVAYARGKQNRLLVLERGEIERVVGHGARLVRLDVEGQQTSAMIKEVQYTPLGRQIAHVDFQEISATETIKLGVPVKLRGTPAGAKDGGVLNLIMHEIEVEVLASQLPEEVRVDISAMSIGDVLRAGQIVLPEGVKLVTDANSTVLALERPRGETDAETQITAAAAAAGPEVLTAKKEAEEGAEGAEGATKGATEGAAATEGAKPKEEKKAAEKKPKASA